MPQKRIVLCSDGTWQSANNGSRSIPSNVAKISRALECWDGDIPQIVYYDTGIGTNVISSTKEDGEADYGKLEGATGAGLSENVCEAYNFVVNNFTEGDQIYIFGFSRGAFTARATAGLLADVGVCDNAMMDQFWEMYTAYKTKKPWESIRETTWGTSSKVESSYEVSNGQYWLQKGNGKQWLDRCKKPDIQVVGVFDTVGSLGYPENVINNSYDKNLEHGFHNTDIHEDIKNAFHALAIDEHRRPFTPTLWYKPEGSKTNLVQCWFPGVHINIGGGSDDGLKELTQQAGDLEGMANVSLAWMVDRVRESTPLRFNDGMLDVIVARYMDNMAQVLQREVQANAASKGSWFKSEVPITFRGWGVGPMSDSFATSDYAVRQVGGSRARAPGRYLFRENKLENAPAAQKATNEYIHPVVAHAWSDPNPAKSSYKAKSPDVWLGGALYGFDRQEQTEGKKGFKYVQKERVSQTQGWIEPSLTKQTTGAEWTSDNYPYWRGPVELQEFQIPPEGSKFKSMERRLITQSPYENIESTPSGADRLKTLQSTDRKSYDELVQEMDTQNKRAIQSLQSWDKANGFA